VSAWIKSVPGGAEMTIHIQPGASKSEIAGLHGDALKIRIQARPIDGAANAALIDFIATWLGVPRNTVRILRGEKSRQKSVSVAVQTDAIKRRIMGNIG